MKKAQFLLAPLLFFLLFSCGTKAPLAPTPPSTNTESLAALSKEGFTPDGALFTNGKIYQDAWETNNLLEETGINNRMVLSRATTKKLTHDSTHFFEMGHYKSMEAGVNQFAYLIAWEKIGNEWLKELEVLYPTHDNPKVNPFLINQARKEWMSYSNDHNPKGLVYEVYTSDAIYFNKGKIHSGREAITERYQYMSKPTWKIELFAEGVLAVRDDIYFEIGRYQSSGKGHYLLIWEKQDEETWQAVLDFNF